VRRCLGRPPCVVQVRRDVGEHRGIVAEAEQCVGTAHVPRRTGLQPARMQERGRPLAVASEHQRRHTELQPGVRRSIVQIGRAGRRHHRVVEVVLVEQVDTEPVLRSEVVRSHGNDLAQQGQTLVPVIAPAMDARECHTCGHVAGIDLQRSGQQPLGVLVGTLPHQEVALQLQGVGFEHPLHRIDADRRLCRERDRECRKRGAPQIAAQFRLQRAERDGVDLLERLGRRPALIERAEIGRELSGAVSQHRIVDERPCLGVEVLHVVVDGTRRRCGHQQLFQRDESRARLQRRHAPVGYVSQDAASRAIRSERRIELGETLVYPGRHRLPRSANHVVCVLMKDHAGRRLSIGHDAGRHIDRVGMHREVADERVLQAAAFVARFERRERRRVPEEDQPLGHGRPEVALLEQRQERLVELFELRNRIEELTLRRVAYHDEVGGLHPFPVAAEERRGGRGRGTGVVTSGCIGGWSRQQRKGEHSAGECARSVAHGVLWLDATATRETATPRQRGRRTPRRRPCLPGNEGAESPHPACSTACRTVRTIDGRNGKESGRAAA
jgi:hypothetical protein